MARRYEKVGIRGFYRVKILNGDGSLHGDSGWHENQITNLGYQDFLCALIGKTTGSKQIYAINIGSGTIPGAADTTLDGEISTAKRAAGTNMTVTISSNSKVVEFKGSFLSAQSFLAASSSLRNIGLFSASDAVGTLFAGSTYAVSTCDTNQNVNVTYAISFGT